MRWPLRMTLCVSSRSKTIETEGGVYNTIKVQPKRSSADIKAFELEGTILDFEGIVGAYPPHLRRYRATGTLSLHDLATGEGGDAH